jgi:hypothetical protein
MHVWLLWLLMLLPSDNNHKIYNKAYTSMYSIQDIDASSSIQLGHDHAQQLHTLMYMCSSYVYVYNNDACIAVAIGLCSSMIMRMPMPGCVHDHGMRVHVCTYSLYTCSDTFHHWFNAQRMLTFSTTRILHTMIGSVETNCTTK